MLLILDAKSSTIKKYSIICIILHQEGIRERSVQVVYPNLELTTWPPANQTTWNVSRPASAFWCHHIIGSEQRRLCAQYSCSSYKVVKHYKNNSFCRGEVGHQKLLDQAQKIPELPKGHRGTAYGSSNERYVIIINRQSTEAHKGKSLCTLDKEGAIASINSGAMREQIVFGRSWLTSNFLHHVWGVRHTVLIIPAWIPDS